MFEMPIRAGLDRHLGWRTGSGRRTQHTGPPPGASVRTPPTACFFRTGGIRTASLDKESIATIHRALERGCFVFDTAEAYGPFVNEELLGRALPGRRDEAVIATKFGWEYEGTRRGELNSKPEHIRTVVDECLGRLETDRIDVLNQHRVDLEVPIEEVAGTVGELIQEG